MISHSLNKAQVVVHWEWARWVGAAAPFQDTVNHEVEQGLLSLCILSLSSSRLVLMEVHSLTANQRRFAIAKRSQTLRYMLYDSKCCSYSKFGIIAIHVLTKQISSIFFTSLTHRFSTSLVHTSATPRQIARLVDQPMKTAKAQKKLLVVIPSVPNVHQIR